MNKYCGKDGLGNEYAFKSGHIQNSNTNGVNVSLIMSDKTLNIYEVSAYDHLNNEEISSELFKKLSKAQKAYSKQIKKHC